MTETLQQERLNKLLMRGAAHVPPRGKALEVTCWAPAVPARRSNHRLLGGNAGLTLVEILVAVTLLGLLAAGLFTALQVAADSWQGARDRLMLDRRIASANTILHSVLSGMVHLEAETPPLGEAGPQRFLFFQGEPRSMRFVTSYSVAAGRRRGLQITELQVVGARAGQRVLLNQKSYRGPRSAGILVEGFGNSSQGANRRPRFRPIRALPTSLIIVDELRECRFSYFDPPRRPGQPGRWVAVWNEPRRLPAAVTIQIAPQRQETRLLPVSVTTPVRAKGVYLGGLQ